MRTESDIFPYLLNFIDFEKALDSIQCESPKDYHEEIWNTGQNHKISEIIL